MRIHSLAADGWQFRDATRRSRWRPAVVPGCVHRDLLRHGLIPDPFRATNEKDVQWVGEQTWEYRARFRVTRQLLAEEVVELVADGLDTVATVFVNGHEIARTDNMFIGWRWNVKPRLRAGSNEVRVRFGSALDYIARTRRKHRPFEFNDPVGRSSVIRKQQCQFGWDWAPRLVTAGIWRDIRLEAWSGNRLTGVRVRQEHRDDGSVRLRLEPELLRAEPAVTLRWRLALDEKVVAQGTGPNIVIGQPELWWPNGHGAQPLHRLDVEVTRASGATIGTWSRKIGLRTVVLDRHPDEWGESFRFVVNGRAIFAKGANWIPAHSFVAGLRRADYARDLRSAAQANMNMLRVWGGGIYESEDFYDLCDELGLLVWQDFMFACTIYPGDAAFAASVREEARGQVTRLRHRACLALWCGNNEIAQLNTVGRKRGDLLANEALARDYRTIFHHVLPEAVAVLDGVTSYWPSSQWRSDFADSASRPATLAEGEKRGDTHYWDVWHLRRPVSEYRNWRFRFCSEFGMQSFSSPATNATFCPPHSDNVFGPEMENHQKNAAGNQIILDYVSRLYRFPKGQDELIYLSQLNQAYCMQTGVEHWRRNMPRCMGALYWQLNDCWPVASWSSIEFTGRWRALHHVARRFFAPALVTAEVPGSETAGIGNYRGSDVREVRIFTVYDAPEPARGTVRWTVWHTGGRVLRRGRKRVALRGGESVHQHTLDLAPLLAQHGRDALVVRIALEIGGACVSDDSVFLTSPRFVQLPEATRTAVAIAMVTPTRARLTFTSAVFQHRFAFELPAVAGAASDNYFELYPGEPKTVTVDFARPQTRRAIARRLRWRSLADTY
ncbi:MAG TPA: glycoside hydrolase family 2 protein [Opitutus sp.]|nr:glycoside hydrolase family 2 protein [Opitutus sp.]